MRKRLPNRGSTQVQGDSVILELEQVTKLAGAETHLYPISCRLTPGSINVLLGPTQAGKTSLMRLIAGLDRPDSGRVLVDGKDVTGVGVRERNLAMVYQQFINYPGLTVFENIAAPLRIQKRPQAEIDLRVNEIADKLHIAHLLQRLPAALSGGQQQRTALARAMVKKAPLLLLDEPLVNLDYKLREQLREELTSLFTDGDTTVVYATTEPQEALLLGGQTALMDAGRLLQFGATLAVYNHPASKRVAAIFNDPPMNMLAASVVSASSVRLADDTLLPLGARTLDLEPGQSCQVGIRCHHVHVKAQRGDAVAIDCSVDLAELSGSETYLHLHHDGTILVAQLSGVHRFSIGAPMQVFINPADAFVFDADGGLLSAPMEVQHGAH
jgi:glycerol transport system ATP-binding protein